jgi:hypothetical protein
MGAAVLGFRAVFPFVGLPTILVGVASYILLVLASGVVTAAERALLLGPLQGLLQFNRRKRDYP